MPFVIPPRPLVLALVLLLLGIACAREPVDRAAASSASTPASATSAASPSASSSPSAVPTARPGTLRALACSLPHEWLLRTWRGWRSDRGAEIEFFPREYDFVGAGLPHVGPWPYVQDVPMLWYGPGHVPARGVVTRPVTVAGIAPTEARLLHFDGFHPPDGIPMSEAVSPSQQPPKLIVAMVWDAGGMDVLNTWKDAWPYLRSLIPKGAWYDHATVGSSPTSTAQIHATIGTGAFPEHHGVIAHRLRIAGDITTPWAHGPQWLVLPTLADVYDRAMGNRPVVGELATVSIHLGLLGHGAMWGGGDKDIATTREASGAATLGQETFRWNLSPLLRQYYRFPAYINDVPGFKADVRRVDAADGRIDGRWRGNDIAQLLDGFDTPARIPYQTRVLEELVRREGFGADSVPDLLFVNYKEIDYISHIWSMNSAEMRDAVVAQDAALKEFVSFLNRQVGVGQWVLALTADHGSMISPRVSGGVQLSSGPMTAGINRVFDHDGDPTPIVELVQPTQMFIDTTELRQNGYTLGQVAEWLMRQRVGQLLQPGETVSSEQAAERAFQAAFPSAMMPSLPCLPEARTAP